MHQADPGADISLYQLCGRPLVMGLAVLLQGDQVSLVIAQCMGGQLAHIPQVGEKLCGRLFQLNGGRGDHHVILNRCP